MIKPPLLEDLPPVKPENQYHLERYIKLISSRPKRDLKREKGFSIHHVYPLSIAKKNNIFDIDGDWNLIKLTAREHFIAHLILWKCGYPEMTYAFKYIVTINRKTLNERIVSSKEYERILKDLHHTDETKQKMSLASKGKSKSKEHKESLRNSKLVKPTKYWEGKEFSKDHKEKLSISKKKALLDPIYRDKVLKNCLKGVKAHQELFLNSYIVYYSDKTSETFENIPKGLLCKSLHISLTTFYKLLNGQISRKNKNILKIILLTL